MSIKRVASIVVLALFLVPALALADTISGSVGAGWRHWTTADLDKDGQPYWDHGSSDGPNKNIGYCLTSANCSLASPPGAMDFWGMPFNSAADTGGAADPKISFHRTSTSSGADLKLELAGNKDFNVFGWFDVAHPATLHVIFTGPDTVGATAIFTPSANYGYFLTGKSGETWYTLASLDRLGEKSDQHFSVFREGGPASQIYWIGMEDLTFRKSDKDFNDMVVRISPVHVPEPASLTLLGSGLIGLAGVLRKKLRS